MHFDISWLTPRLAIGGCVREEAIEWIARELKIEHVIDLRSEVVTDPKLWTSHGVRFLALPTQDHSPVAGAALERGVNYVASVLRSGARVLVHCQCGIGRSVFLACCVLVTMGFTPSAALALAKSVRPIVSPHPEQLHALLSFAASRCHKNGLPLPTTTWEDLAAIAYAKPHNKSKIAQPQ